MQKNNVNNHILLNKFFIDIKVEKQHMQKLKKKVFLLHAIKDANFKMLNSKEFFFNKNQNFKQIYSVSYIIDITFSRTNTFLVLMDCFGNIKFFCSAGLFKPQNKKKSRFLIIKDFSHLLISRFEFLKTKPIALNLKNVGFDKFWIIKQLKKKFFVKVVKIFNKYPYNGCRKKKVRRKKFKKKSK